MILTLNKNLSTNMNKNKYKLKQLVSGYIIKLINIFTWSKIGRRVETFGV